MESLTCVFWTSRARGLVVASHLRSPKVAVEVAPWGRAQGTMFFVLEMALAEGRSLKGSSCRKHLKGKGPL